MVWVNSGIYTMSSEIIIYYTYKVVLGLVKGAG